MPFSMQIPMQIKQWIIAGLLGCLPAMASAETAYVIDRLLVGVYKDRAQTGTALEILPTGASLEVLARKKDLVRVRTAAGIEGWLDGNYLMPEKPAQLLLLELEAAHEETKARLREAEARLEGASPEGETGDLGGSSGFLFYLWWALVVLGLATAFTAGVYLARWVLSFHYYLIRR